MDVETKNTTIIVIPHTMSEPCFYILEGERIDIKTEIDILTIQREARGKRLDSKHQEIAQQVNKFKESQ